MIGHLLLFLGSITPSTRVESVDMIELNNRYDREGKHVFTQVIFWRRNPGNGKYEVRQWCLVEDRETLNRRPVQSANGRWTVRMRLDDGKYKEVQSSIFRESWSFSDPEIDDKQKLPQHLRYSLAKPITKEPDDGDIRD